ncbi:MAG: CRTAC1 family protein [Actinomycetota bacterium]
MKRATAAILCALVVAPLSIPVEAAPNTDDYRFRRVQRNGPLGAYTRTWGAAWLDYDQDGDPDLFLGRHQYKPWFLVRTAHAFSQRFDGMFGKVDRHNCAWGEANRDGAPDLYCTTGAFKGQGEGPNQLFLRTQDGYTNEATERGVADGRGRGRSVNWIDFDTDGDLDIFVGNKRRFSAAARMFRNNNGNFENADIGIDEPDVANATWADWDNDRDPDLLILRGVDPAVMYENIGGRFRRISLPPITTKKWRSASWGDFNADGWIDLHLVRAKRAVLLRNSGGGFERIDGRRLATGRMSAWLDVENDGDLDLFIVQGAFGFHPEPDAVNRPDRLLLNRRGRLTRLRHRVLDGPSRGTGGSVTISDYNRDGRADILVTNGFQAEAGRLWLIRNRSRSGRWIGIDLVGPAPNPLGYGSRIIIETKGKTYRRQVTDGVTYRSQQEVGYALFGLATARRADIQIKWPDGTRSCYRARTNRAIRAVHGRAPCN